jgi:hypothetical protein
VISHRLVESEKKVEELEKELVDLHEALAISKSDSIHLHEKFDCLMESINSWREKNTILLQSNNNLENQVSFLNLQNVQLVENNSKFPNELQSLELKLKEDQLSCENHSNFKCSFLLFIIFYLQKTNWKRKKNILMD